ncbi:general odorant-binding protein 19d [Asbolus verrucosus]|uniref:General odorant-binding protein 19d n=1 Tax=Asbolus verrucosus TaxID=1661398 RepID=A0A482VSY0_ASBVE|nr:general odorant-binding protein 19d [Asbolus verrucosus]
MKFLLILSSLILGTIAIDQSFLEAARSKIKKKLVECIDEEHSSQSDLDEILALHVPASHEGKCAIFCTHKKFDLQHEDGSINQEGALETFEIIKEVDEEFYQKWVNVFNSCSSSKVLT